MCWKPGRSVKMAITALQSMAHTRQVIAAILNICIILSPAITADDRAILHGIAQHHVVVVGQTDSGAATPLIRIRGHDQIFSKRGQASINPGNTSLSPNTDPGNKVDKQVPPTSNIDVHPRFDRVKPVGGWVIRTCVYDIECPLLLDTYRCCSVINLESNEREHSHCILFTPSYKRLMVGRWNYLG